MAGRTVRRRGWAVRRALSRTNWLGSATGWFTSSFFYPKTSLFQLQDTDALHKMLGIQEAVAS